MKLVCVSEWASERVSEWVNSVPPHTPCKVVDKQQMEGAQKKTFLPVEKGWGIRIYEIPPSVIQIHSSIYPDNLFPSLPDPGKPHTEEASAQGLNSHHICMSLPFVSVLSLLYQTLVPAHEGIFMKDTDLLSSTLERPTMLLCQTTTKSNLWKDR